MLGSIDYFSTAVPHSTDTLFIEV